MASLTAHCPHPGALVLSTGGVQTINCNYNARTATSRAIDGGIDGDRDLEALLPGQMLYDTVSLEFDVRFERSGSFQMTYVYGSDEYNEWVGSAFNDIVGIFISPLSNGNVNLGNTTNVALIPDAYQQVRKRVRFRLLAAEASRVGPRHMFYVPCIIYVGYYAPLYGNCVRPRASFSVELSAKKTSSASKAVLIQTTLACSNNTYNIINNINKKSASTTISTISILILDVCRIAVTSSQSGLPPQLP